MTEKQDGKWLVQPKTGIAHYVLWWPSHPLFSIRLRCNKNRKADNSWSPMEGHERKCRKCEHYIKMDNAPPVTLDERIKTQED
jgi:hypothetical protein